VSPEFRRQLAFLLVIAAVVLAAGLGLRDPWPADEPRFALIARDMAESGNWLFPHVGGVLYPDKPPLFFWLVAVLYAITGSLRVAFLLPGFLSGMAVLVLVTDLARRLRDETTAIYCGGVLLALLQFPMQMKTGQIDPFLCFWTTLGLYGLSRHLLLGPDWRWYTIGGLAAGFGVITKGVGFLPYLIFLPYAYAARKDWPVLRHTWRDRRWLLAPIASLLAIAVWFAPMMITVVTTSDPELIAYRDNILLHQTVTRYADSWGHIKPPWYLITNAASWLWLPVTAALPWLIPAWRRDLRNRDAAVLLLGTWILIVLAFFSLSSGKRSLYIFPAAPAVALLAGFHAKALLERAGPRRLLVGFTLLIGLAVAGVGAWVLWNPHELERVSVPVVSLVAAAGALLAAGLAMLVAVAVCRRRRAVTGFAVGMVALWIALSIGVAPAIDGTRSGRSLIETVEQMVDDDRSLAFVGWPEQFLLQWPRAAVHFGFRRDAELDALDAASWLARNRDGVVLLPDTVVAPCFLPDRVRTVGVAHRRTWVLADHDALSGTCGSDVRQPDKIVEYRPSVSALGAP